jgi:hypothetical protein
MIVTPMPIIIPMHTDWNNNWDMPTRFIIFVIICTVVIWLFTIDWLFWFKVTQSLWMFN